MERRRAPDWLCIGVLAAACWGVACTEAGAGLGEDFEALVAMRDGLAESLEARGAAGGDEGSVSEVRLRLDEGADHEELRLLLRRRDGRWVAAEAEVPAWSQSTMQEWRGFHLANGAGCAWRHNRRFAVDTAGVAIRDGRLGGRLEVAFRLDQPLDEKLPPGSRPGWWDHFVATGHTIPRGQAFALDAAVREDAWVLDMVLEGGVHWDPTKTTSKQDAAVVVRPILVTLRVPSDRFTAPKVKTPTWNGGFHEGNATGLSMEGGRLRGELVIDLHQDGWMPWATKTWQHAPQVLRFRIDARLEHNVLSGTFAARGDMGEYAGRVLGRGGKAIVGRYEARGGFGEHAGPVEGMLEDDAAPVREAMAKALPLPKDAGEAARHVASRVGRVLHEIRALHLALQHEGMALAEALAQTDVAAPVWSADGGPDVAALAAYCHEARRLVEAAPSPAKSEMPEAGREGADATVSLGAAAAPVGEDGANLLPAEAGDGWYFLSRWRVLGPFEQRLGLEHNAGAVVEVVPGAGVSWRQETDRYGARLSEPREQTWQEQVCESARLSPPWQKPAFYNRFRGEVWYAAARLHSAKARRVWLSLEAADHAKVWVNGCLVWVDAEKAWRYRPRGRAVVPVKLEAGANQVLVRGHRDRRPSWVRLAVACRDPGAGAEGAPDVGPVAGPHVFPDASPPLAWDIDGGKNVAWRRTDLAGGTRPLIVGDALFVTDAPHTLHCLDLATGKTRWSREANVLEFVDREALEAWGSSDDPARRAEMLEARKAVLGFGVRNLSDLVPADPVSDGKHVWMHTGTGVVACYGLGGERCWAKRTHLGRAVVHQRGDLLVAEGATTATWPQAAEGKAERSKSAVGVVVFEAATGEERGRWRLPGRFHGPFSRVFVHGGAGQDVVVLLASTGARIDLGAMRVLPGMNLTPLDLGGPASAASGYGGGTGHAMAANGDTLFLTTQDQSLAVRLWATGDGQPAYAERWESNYEHAGFGSFVAPSVATDRYLFTWVPVLDRGPHCPCPLEELHVQDAATGRPLARLKPALSDVVRHDVTPVVAGPYVFCVDVGGGSHGGHQTHGQLLVATADDRLQAVCRNLVDMGTHTSPLFARERMVLRSGKALTCIAVTTDDGRAYQSRRLAEALFAELGPRPEAAAARDVAPLAEAPAAGVPVGKLRDGRATAFWLGAGPFAPGAVEDEAALVSLRPTPGAEATFGDRTCRFARLSREQAYDDPPLFKRQHALQGTGDIVPYFTTWLDPRCASGDGGVGLFYTVLDNTRDRVVVASVEGPGVAQWLGGVKVEVGRPLHLGPGLYPYLVRVDPEHYASKTGLPDLPGLVKSKPEYRLEPGFDEVPHPPTLLARWLDAVRARRVRLEAVVRDLAGTDEAEKAAGMLAEVSE